MSTPNASLGTLIRAVGDALAELSDDEHQRLLSGRFKIKLSLVEVAAPKNKLENDLGPTGDRTALEPGSAPESQTTPGRPRGSSSLKDDESSDRRTEHKGTAAKGLKRPPSSRQGRLPGAGLTSPEVLETLAKKLNACKTRDEPHALLEGDLRLGAREDLVRLAKILTIYVAKHDDRETIERKLIEGTVGAKLRTDAIQGLNLKRTGTSSNS